MILRLHWERITDPITNRKKKNTIDGKKCLAQLMYHFDSGETSKITSVGRCHCAYYYTKNSKGIFMIKSCLGYGIENYSGISPIGSESRGHPYGKTFAGFMMDCNSYDSVQKIFLVWQQNHGQK
ncbi:hypothetical protein BB559_004955 [Furculomyces boomerangus]|uniref:Uncharacterized protein n=2 Tax=Harpellales TaxID=61421 RepID=A0A2T9YBT3_9FUNG|nr:hypothetical protein BB559_004955 [Furculomyces boomerangus]PWA01331.1 hypothetical protein BB558_002576 [Smittium angustum]